MRLVGRNRVLMVLAAVVALAAGVAAAVLVGGSSDSAGLPVGTALNTSLDFNPTQSQALSRAQYLALAKQGVAKTSKWWDPNLHWYRDDLGDSHPVSLWDSVSMFELLDEVAMAQPNRSNRAAVESFAAYYRNYWNPNLQPVPGYSPHPGQQGAHQPTWYDDAGWLGLAFMDADRATGSRRYLVDAGRAMAFIEGGGWDRKRGGGMWWDTEHPWLSGEALAADTDLAARLYQVTHKAVYLRSATTWMAWANKHLRQPNGVYIQTSSVPYGSETYTGSGPASAGPGGRQNVKLPPVCERAKSAPECVMRLCKTKHLCLGRGPAVNMKPNPGHRSHPTTKSVAMPHDGEGAMLSAMVTLYQATGNREWLAEAEKFAPNIIKWLEPFDDGPQYDGIMLRGFVDLYAQDHDPRWYAFVTSMASIILRTARSGPGVYLKAWGGGPLPNAKPGMLRTDASSLMVFADLATVDAPDHAKSGR